MCAITFDSMPRRPHSPTAKRRAPRCLEESPVDKHQKDEAQSRQRTILLQQQLPVDTHSRPSVLFAIVAKTAANLAHLLEVVAAVQQILDILGHDFRDVAQLVVELVEVLRRARVGIRRARLGDEAVKVHKRIRPQRRVVHLVRRVGAVELGGEVGEVGKGQLARVRALADAQEDNVRVDEVVQRVLAALDRGLRLRVAGELAEDLADLALDFGEGGFGLESAFFVSLSVYNHGH